ncbi:integral membrane protein [Purpureocillium lavendulum]|uniref:Integral membrane protein n=1 Tax=Purpureocillium lavendulum TaxID=1247861 RepID=A0AB34G2S5_9HYPO|nr:integral membrane protein [Purpureocillium lavendulum]
MPPPLHPLAAARPRGLRHSSAPRTPEPAADGSLEPSSPPRPRFRLKRRIVSERTAPTQQFLASVAAADVPIPSIEEPQVYDDDMLDTDIYPGVPILGNLDDIRFSEQDTRGRPFSAPKTPAPRAIPSLSPKRFPDWSIDASISSIESSPECESSRPSTARSTQTSASLFSRYSLTSEDFSQCASPEEEHPDKFTTLLPAGDLDKTVRASAPPRGKLRKAPWTRAMSKHLWGTYMMYLQDPKVTPFRIGKSGIPPSGVCMRVAREAKRSWKGSRPQTKADAKSGSTTPTAEAQGPYVQWPHTCAATRGHLREMCKANSGTASRGLHYMARSPTPFGRAANRARNRRSAPLQSPSVFSSSDMAMSLTVSTSDSMQPSGPLAQLSSSQPRLTPGLPTPASNASRGLDQAVRLGSPFMAKSYGPSSSSNLTEDFGVRTEPHRQSHTLGTRRSLGSPVRLSDSRPSTQKRRSRQSILETRRSKRPSLGSDFWTDPSATAETSSTGAISSSFPEFCSTSSNLRDDLFVPRTNVQELFESSHPPPFHSEGATMPNPTGLAPPMMAPPRLGSPFSAKSQSFSFPSRNPNTSVIDFAIVRRPFATVHQPADNATGSPRPSLANRLAYIDERLKDFRRRDPHERRSHSPF